jgi:agmatine deiminase
MDETDGHVDNLCAYVRPAEVVLNWTDDRNDPQYESSREAYERLKEARDARGRRFEVHKLVQPGPLLMTAEEAAGVDSAEGTKRRQAGDRLAGSYVNFYLGTKRVVAPLLDRKRDGAALRKLKSLFPRHEVVGVQGREILLGGGNVHCITQQVPAGAARRRSAAARR